MLFTLPRPRPSRSIDIKYMQEDRYVLGMDNICNKMAVKVEEVLYVVVYQNPLVIQLNSYYVCYAFTKDVRR
jgi:hypothetical protein